MASPLSLHGAFPVGENFLLMLALGPNVAGVIGSAIAAGVMLKYVLAM
ncbi:hypothetical protein EXM23_17225 [Salmonella enterica subsp. enterica serovar Enteritidis]|nr:hypothetical protein EXM23_17225 [Salmonella enterica subsp. enterica serovar Enteritidis]